MTTQLEDLRSSTSNMAFRLSLHWRVSGYQKDFSLRGEKLAKVEQQWRRWKARYGKNDRKSGGRMDGKRES